MPAIPKRIINMKHYYVNKNPQIRGEHEVHSSDCIYLPTLENRQYLKCTPNIGRISICLDGMSSVLYRAHVV